MKGYFIDSDAMQELWVRLTEIDLDNVNEVRDALGFAKGILYPTKLADYLEIANPNKSENYYEIIVPKGIWNAKHKTESDGSEDKKDCTTCIGFVDNDYERWFCHDCIKGIQNHYKAKSEVRNETDN